MDCLYDTKWVLELAADCLRLCCLVGSNDDENTVVAAVAAVVENCVQVDYTDTLDTDEESALVE
jgi:hypothetical protein